MKKQKMRLSDMANRYYEYNGKVVFVDGDFNRLWSGGDYKAYVCRKRTRARVSLLDLPFILTDEEIPLTPEVLAAFSPIETKCSKCNYCETIKLPIGLFASKGFEKGRQCALRMSVRCKSLKEDSGALAPDCPCFCKEPLVYQHEGTNEAAEAFVREALLSYGSEFVKSSTFMPAEKAILSVLNNPGFIIALDIDRTFGYYSHNIVQYWSAFKASGSSGHDIIEYWNAFRKDTDWKIRAWCAFETLDPVFTIRAIWELHNFQFEGTMVLCAPETNRILLLADSVPAGYFLLRGTEKHAE